MTRLYTVCILILFFLAACSPEATTTDVDRPATEISRQVATEVSRRLTAMPTAPISNAGLTPTAVSIPPTSAPALTATLEPTATLSSTATKTPLPTDPKQTLGAPTWRDTFDSAANWYLYEDDHTKIELANGNLLLNAKNADGWSGWALSWPFLQDFYLETTMTPGDCTGLDRYGLVFRAQNPDEAYLFGVSCSENYSLRRWDGDLFTMVQIWTPSPAINSGPGQSNVIGILAQGETLAMYINGQFLGTVTDEADKEGSIGLFVGSVNTTGFQVAAKEVAYWELSTLD